MLLCYVILVINIGAYYIFNIHIYTHYYDVFMLTQLTARSAIDLHLQNQAQLAEAQVARNVAVAAYRDERRFAWEQQCVERQADAQQHVDRVHKFIMFRICIC